jgi:hypothetical protein
LKFRLPTLLAVIATLVFTVPSAALANEKNKSIFGYVERVIITNKGFSVKARLDTGAATSSLDAVNIRRFRRGGTRYVRFDVLDPDSEEFVTLERELVRNVLIRQLGAPSERRPVVKMPLCVGHIMREVEVNLTSRTGFLYPMLIGRSAMRGVIIVDPELTFTRAPTCDPAEFGQ